MQTFFAVSVPLEDKNLEKTIGCEKKRIKKKQDNLLYFK